jgi:hypothetical protein
MRRIRMSVAQKWLREGRMECVTDLKLGYVEVSIRKISGGWVRETVEVIQD